MRLQLNSQYHLYLQRYSTKNAHRIRATLDAVLENDYFNRWPFKIIY